MLFRLKPFMAFALAVGCLVAPAKQSAAQDKPVAVVSIASVNELMNDIEYITEAAGAKEFGGLVRILSAQYVEGLDKTKPIGVSVTMQGPMPSGLGFIPVTDLDSVLGALSETIGEAEDLGGGILELGASQPQSVFLKEQGGWAFVAQSPDQLGSLPADPAAALGDLPSRYSIAIQVNMTNVPDDLKEMAKMQLQAGFEQELENPGADALDAEAIEKIGKNSMRQMEEFIDGAEQLTIGWQIDAEEKTTYFDVNMTALAGTDLASRMAMLKNTKSNFAGFNVPDAAATMTLAARSNQEDIEQALVVLKSVREKAMQEIDKDGDLPNAEAKEAAKEVLGSLMDVVSKTVESGKVDAGGALVLKPGELAFGMGMYLQEGNTLDDAFRKLVNLAKNEPDFPEVKFDSDSHGDVKFHTLSAPVADPEAQKMFGDTLDVYLGVGADSAYIAFGNNSLSMIKSAIDASAAAGEQDAPPFNVSISALAIAEFAASMDENSPAGMVAALLKAHAGNDHILLTGKAIDRGINYRFEVEEGVLQVLGQMGKMAGGGPGGPGAGGPGGGGFDDGGF